CVAVRTTESQKSSPSVTSIAEVDNPRRELSMFSPARSSLVKIRPDFPRARWLWSIWSARVDLPQSIVPEKNTSSATDGTLSVRPGRDRQPGHGELVSRQRD